MALFKKHKTEPVPPEDTGAHDTSVGTAADVEAVMKKYDRESNTRVWEGLPKLVIRWLMVAFSAYCIIDTVFLSTRQEVRLPMFVGLILLFGFLTFPAKKGDERVNHMPWYDIVLLIAGPGAYFFYAVNAQNVVQMSARVMQNDLYMIIGLIGILALALIAPPLTSIALKFTSPEYFTLALFGVMICGSIVTSDIPLKGWIGGLVGLLIAQIGMDTLQGASRFDFGNNALMGGIEMVPAMIGFYAIPEVIKAFAKHDDEDMTVNELKNKSKEKVAVIPLVYGKIRLIIQSALIGIGIGALPGVGEDVAAWVAYGAAKKTSKEPEKFGTGSYEGAIAPEVGNNAAIGGAMIPMLTLAVPGSPPAAVLLGALMIHNIRPGPMIMRDNPTFIYYVAALLFISVVALWIAGIILAKPMTKILKVPKIYLMPIVAALSIVGAYAINNRAFDIVVCLVFGILGYILDKMQYSPAPIVLGIILGNMIDENFRRALIVSDGSLSIFVTRPISLVFLVIIAITILRMIFKKKPAAQAETESVAAASNEEE